MTVGHYVPRLGALQATPIVDPDTGLATVALSSYLQAVSDRIGGSNNPALPNYLLASTASSIYAPLAGATFTGPVKATVFSGAGTGLTGTASSLSIGGNAGTATLAVTATSANGLLTKAIPSLASGYLQWTGTAFAWGPGGTPSWPVSGTPTIVSTFGALANATGALTNNGTGTLSYTALPVASTTLPGMDGTASYGSGTTWARADHVHPTDTTRAVVPTVTATAGGTLTAGMWVYLYNNAGALTAQAADSTNATKPAMGFVLAGYSVSAAATVYLSGVNTLIPVGSYVAANLGSPVFLGTSGGTTLTPPATTGNLLQQVGWVDAVGSTVTVGFLNSPGIVRA